MSFSLLVFSGFHSHTLSRFMSVSICFHFVPSSVPFSTLPYPDTALLHTFNSCYPSLPRCHLSSFLFLPFFSLRIIVLSFVFITSTHFCLLLLFFPLFLSSLFYSCISFFSTPSLILLITHVSLSYSFISSTYFHFLSLLSHFPFQLHNYRHLPTSRSSQRTSKKFPWPHCLVRPRSQKNYHDAVDKMLINNFPQHWLTSCGRKVTKVWRTRNDRRWTNVTLEA